MPLAACRMSWVSPLGAAYGELSKTPWTCKCRSSSVLKQSVLRAENTQRGVPACQCGEWHWGDGSMPGFLGEAASELSWSSVTWCPEWESQAAGIRLIWNTACWTQQASRLRCTPQSPNLSAAPSASFFSPKGTPWAVPGSALCIKLLRQVEHL